MVPHHLRRIGRRYLSARVLAPCNQLPSSVRPYCAATTATGSASASTLCLPQLPQTFAAFCEAFPHQCSKQIEYRDLDAYNHVNNTVYFSFYEEVRVRTWRLSTGNETFAANGIAPVLQDTVSHARSLACHTPACLPPIL